MNNEYQRRVFHKARKKEKRAQNKKKCSLLSLWFSRSLFDHKTCCIQRCCLLCAVQRIFFSSPENQHFATSFCPVPILPTCPSSPVLLLPLRLFPLYFSTTHHLFFSYTFSSSSFFFFEQKSCLLLHTHDQEWINLKVKVDVFAVSKVPSQDVVV